MTNFGNYQVIYSDDSYSNITFPYIVIANISNKAVKVDDRIVNAIDSLLSSAEDLPDKIKRRVITNISKLKKIVGV